MKGRTFVAFLTTLLFTTPVFAQTSGERLQPILVDEIGSMRNAPRNIRQRGTAKVPERPTAAIREIERSAFALMNAERAKKGLESLRWSEDIAGVARLHSANMAAYQFFGHRGTDGTMVDDRADMLGLSSWDAIGENIAFMQGFPDPGAVAIDKWLNSPSHRRNMLSRQWKESAIGVAVSDDGAYYFTQVFLLRK